MNKKSISAKELAEYFEVSMRTIYRDIDVLSASGIPIYATKGRNGGISLMDHYVLNKSIVSKEEQQQILTSLKSISFTSKREIDSTLRKLSSFFDVKEDGWLEVDYRGWSSSEDYQVEFALFKDAILKNKQVSLVYYGRNSVQNKRVINPYKVLYKGADWYVHAFCTTANDFRFFKFNRMKDIKLLDSTFTKVALTKATKQSYEQKKCSVIIKVNKQVAHRVLDEMKNKIISEDATCFMVNIEMEEEWLYSYLFTYLDQIEVIEPKEVRMKMKEIANNIKNKY